MDGSGEASDCGRELFLVLVGLLRPRVGTASPVPSCLPGARPIGKAGFGGEPCLPSAFVPAVVVPDSSPAPVSAGRMEIVGANDCRIVVGPDFDASALRRLLDVLGTSMIPVASGVKVWLANRSHGYAQGLSQLVALCSGSVAARSAEWTPVCLPWPQRGSVEGDMA